MLGAPFVCPRVDVSLVTPSVYRGGMEQGRGSCLCGRVRFSIDVPVKWVAHCHCSMCRRAHGAAFVTWVGVQDTAYRVVAGEEALRWYASSEEGKRGFCGECGSTLFFACAHWPGEMHIARANVDTALDQPPQVHAFFDTHVDWAAVDPNDGLPRRTAEEILAPKS